MHLFKTLALSTALAAASLAATAQEQLVRVSGTYTTTPTPAAAPFVLEFRVPDPLTGFFVESPQAFGLADWDVTATFGGTTLDLVAQPAWFSFLDISYAGFDIRMRSVLAPGDLYQMILLAPAPMYSGPTSAPTLLALDLASLNGEICYYATGSGSCTFTGSVFNTRYTVSAVPEPAALLLMPAGLALIGWRLQRQRRNPAA